MTRVENGELRISRKRSGGRAFFRSEGKVYLDFVRLSAIDTSGGSDIRSRNRLKLDELSVIASGGSDVSVFGKPKQRTVSNDRSSDVHWH